MPLSQHFGRAAALAFLVALVTLFEQILLHRVISAKLLNNYAFLIISLTLLGFALSGVVLTRFANHVEARFEQWMVFSSLAFVASLVSVTAVFYGLDVPPSDHSRQGFVMELLGWIPVALLFALPFAFSGIILGSLLSAAALPTGKVYGADLAGSAVGALLVLPALTQLGAEEALLLGCGALLLGTAWLCAGAASALRATTAVVGLATLLVMLWANQLFVMKYASGSMLDQVENSELDERIEYIAWDSLARIEVSQIAAPSPKKMPFASILGDSTAFHESIKKMVTQNNFAFTFAPYYDGQNEAMLTGLTQTIYASGYVAETTPKPSAMIIGVGGGVDVLTALAFDARKIDAVEINAATIDVLTTEYADYFDAWVTDERVNLVNGDGRDFLAQTDKRYDLIQLSGVDSYSGTPGAAHVFSESYLYTAEAFDLYLSRLTEHGVMNMMRLEFPLAREMLRALVTANAALRRLGIEDPSKHIVTISQWDNRFTALLVKRSPFTEAEISRIHAWTQKVDSIKLTYAPGRRIRPLNAYAQYLSLASPDDELTYQYRYPMNIRPATDDQPFFFHFTRWSHVATDDPMLQVHSLPTVEISLVVLFVMLSLACLLCVVLPLRAIEKRGLAVQGAGRLTAYFAALGLGFMFVEIALLQKFGLFLGHPNYALSVVLAAMLAATGCGALIAERVGRNPRLLQITSVVLLVTVLVEAHLVWPHLMSLVTMPWMARAFIVFLLVLPLGLCLGVFFPYGLNLIKQQMPAYAPWAWGVNGIFSVLGPVAAVTVSMQVGISSLALLAVPVYFIAVLVLRPLDSQVDVR